MTPILICIAARGSVCAEELAERLGKSKQSVTAVLHRLRKRGLVIGRSVYRLNPYLTRYYEFRAYLRILAKESGLTLGRVMWWSKPQHRRAQMPSNLFSTEQRTLLLTLLSVLGAAYSSELASVIGKQPIQICTNLQTLEAQGFVSSKVSRGRRLYSVRKNQRGYEQLAALLRRMVQDNNTLANRLHAILFFRSERSRRGSALKVAFYAELRSLQPRAPSHCHGRTMSRIGRVLER
jgi:DNA-binding MarR family transcriptional regulator